MVRKRGLTFPRETATGSPSMRLEVKDSNIPYRNRTSSDKHSKTRGRHCNDCFCKNKKV